MTRARTERWLSTKLLRPKEFQRGAPLLLTVTNASRSERDWLL